MSEKARLPGTAAGQKRDSSSQDVDSAHGALVESRPGSRGSGQERQNLRPVEIIARLRTSNKPGDFAVAST